MTHLPPSATRSRGSLLVTLCLITSVLTHAEAANYAPAVGSLHPDVTLPRIGDRQPVSLSDFRGKKVLLIHFASW